MRTLTMTRVGPWNVRIVFQGERYGLKGCVVHDEEEPRIEFYDAEQSAEEFGPRGLWVNSYNASTILSMEAGSGLMLRRNVPAWTVQPSQLAAVIDWATNQCIYEGGK